MQYVSAYDDSEKLIEKWCEQYDLTEPEIIDILIDEALNNPDSQFYGGDLV